MPELEPDGRTLRSVRTAIDQSTDEQCWQRAADGDGQAFAEVFERHADAVYTHCRRRTDSVADAEDLTSVTFLEAWRIRERVRFIGGSARAWLLVIATNVSRNHARAARRYRSNLARLPHEQPAIDESAEAMERQDVVRAVANAVSSLNRADYAVISLCDLAGLTYADAAHVLGIPIGTVRSRLSRARTRLRGLLAPLDPYSASGFDAEPTAHYGDAR